MLMKNVITNFAFPAIIGSVLVLPFIALEYVNTQGFKALGFPAMLFAFMWLLSFAFAFLLIPVVRDARSGSRVFAHPTNFLLRVILMLGIAMLWIGVVNDQMPCFLGLPNCD